MHLMDVKEREECLFSVILTMVLGVLWCVEIINV